MTGDDDLRGRLSRIDPMRPGAADPLPSLTAAELKERAMQTIETDLDGPQSDHSAPWRRPRLLAAAAAVVLVLGASAVFATSGDDPAPEAGKPTTPMRPRRAPCSTWRSCAECRSRSPAL
jgi:hypothetical protein